MVRLRYWFIIFTGWLVFLFNIERLIRPVDITKYTYVFVTLVALVILLVPGAQRVSIWLLTGIPSLLLVLLQIWTRDPVLGAEFPVTITEICGVVLTGIFAKEMNRDLHDFEGVVSKIAINHAGFSITPFEQEQRVMYKELKRARLYKRPLSLLRIHLNSASLQKELPHILENYKQGLINQMALASVVKALDRALFETDIIAYYENSLIIVLPELDAANLSKVVQKIQKTAKDDTEFDLEIGAANYPQDAVTFESLLEIATERVEKRDKSSEGPG
jgi:hypothetical protein